MCAARFILEYHAAKRSTPPGGGDVDGERFVRAAHENARPDAVGRPRRPGGRGSSGEAGRTSRVEGRMRRDFDAQQLNLLKLRGSCSHRRRRNPIVLDDELVAAPTRTLDDMI